MSDQVDFFGAGVAAALVVVAVVWVIKNRNKPVDKDTPDA